MRHRPRSPGACVPKCRERTLSAGGRPGAWAAPIRTPAGLRGGACPDPGDEVECAVLGLRNRAKGFPGPVPRNAVRFPPPRSGRGAVHRTSGRLRPSGLLRGKRDDVARLTAEPRADQPDTGPAYRAGTSGFRQCGRSFRRGRPVRDTRQEGVKQPSQAVPVAGRSPLPQPARSAEPTRPSDIVRRGGRLKRHPFRVSDPESERPWSGPVRKCRPMSGLPCLPRRRFTVPRHGGGSPPPRFRRARPHIRRAR